MPPGPIPCLSSTVYVFGVDQVDAVGDMSLAQAETRGRRYTRIWETKEACPLSLGMLVDICDVHMTYSPLAQFGPVQT